MVIKRRMLYAGAFLASAGAVGVLAQSGAVSTQTITDALAFWPVAPIAIGAGLILRKTEAAIPSGAIAAAIPGLLVGGVAVSVPGFDNVCSTGEPGAFTTRTGDFVGAGPDGANGDVELRLACGDLTVSTLPGTAWRLETAQAGRPEPDITSTQNSLTVASADRKRVSTAMNGRDSWRVALPTDPTLNLTTEVDAGTGRLVLVGAHIDELHLNVNAGQAYLDLTGATVKSLVTKVNAGQASVILPGGSDITATFSTNVGELQLCTPSDLGIRIRSDNSAATTKVNGLTRVNGTWQSSNYDTALYHADVVVTTSLGSVNVNPTGGCK